jgi:hypothetical protein
MANQVTKIYELKTIGYDLVNEQLTNINTQFDQIRASKQKLNQTKLTTDDAKTIDELTKALEQEKIKTKELQLQKIQLRNEKIALDNASKREARGSKEAKDAIEAETGSVIKLKEQAKLLRAELDKKGPDSNILFGGQTLTRSEGLNKLQAINGEIKKMGTNMSQTQDFGARMTNAINNGFSSMKTNLSQIIFLYTGWFAAFREIGSLVAENVKLSDSYADLQIRIHGTRGDVENLVDSLRKIDTRTSLSGLVDIANVIAKKGVAPTQIAALTTEFDKLNVVLGHEIGEPQTAVANIIKLITIFNDDKQVTANRVNDIATSLFKLTTSGVATGEFLVNFAERVGAVRGITGLTLPNVLGLGAALQQLGQRTEVAGTAAVQLTTRIFADVPKFALAAKVSVEDFRKTLKDNPFEALVQVAEGLKNLGDEELNTKFEDVVRAFGEVGVTGVRIKAVLGDIGTNADFVRDKMAKAAISAHDYANQTAAADLKQHTFAATLERIRKEFELLGTSRGVQAVLATVGAIILGLISSLNIILPLLATYGALWLVANSAMIAAKITTVALNAALIIQKGAILAADLFMKAYRTTIALFTETTTGAAAATTLLSGALKLLGVGAILTLVGILTGSFTFLTSKINGTTDALRDYISEKDALNEVSVEATKINAKEIAEMESLVKVITATTTSADTQKLAMDQLVKLHGDFAKAIVVTDTNMGRFSGTVKTTTIDLDILKQTMKDVEAQMDLTARAQAAGKLTQDKLVAFQGVSVTRQTLETQIATGPTRQFSLGKGARQVVEIDTSFEVFPKGTVRDIFFGALKDVPAGAGQVDISIGGVAYDSKLVFAALQARSDKAFKNYQTYNDIARNAQGKVDAENKKAEALKAKFQTIGLEQTILESRDKKLSIPELQTLIKQINEERDKYKEGDAKLETLRIARDEFQKRLDDLDPNKTKKTRPTRPFTGSRLTGEEKDQLAEIEADRQQALAEEELRFSELQKDHRASAEEEITYKDNVHKINQQFIQQKIDYLAAQRSLNAREKLELAQFRKELIDADLKFQQERQSILDKEFNLQAGNLRTTLQNQINAIQTRSADVQDDASLSAEERAKVKLASDQEILALQEKFNADMDALEKRFNQKTRENADEGAKTRRDIMRDTIEILNAQLKDASDAFETVGSELDFQLAEKTKAILEDEGKSAIQKAREIEALENEFNKQQLNNRVAFLKIELDLYEKGNRDKLKSDKDYLKAKAALAEAEAELEKITIFESLSTTQKFVATLKNFKDGFLENVLGIKKYTKDAKGDFQKHADATAEAYGATKKAIETAKQAYFDGLNATVEKEHDVQTERLKQEKEQVLARATTQAEKDSIEKQYAAKQKELDKQESERKKAIALKQIAIDYAVSVVKSLAQYGLPLALLPIAAETALYFVQRAAIQKQTFEKGGVPKRGGKIVGPAHKDGGVKLVHDEVEGEELMVINKKSATSGVNYQVSGTPRQIASAINAAGGGVNFDPGGVIYRKYESGGVLGSGFTAPDYTPSSQTDFSAYHKDIVNLAKEQSERIDRIEIVLDSAKVTDAQRKRQRQNEIGDLI